MHRIIGKMRRQVPPPREINRDMIPETGLI
jgi:hypothetical protein